MILTELQYSTDRKGPFKLYIYEPNSQFHRGGVWFEKKPHYREEGEIATEDARKRTFEAMADKREVRICDVGDNLVFHFLPAKGVVYGETFWAEVEA